MISSGKATLSELESIYSIEDMYDILEVLAIDSHNRYLIQKHSDNK